MARFTVKPSSKTSVKAASTVVPRYDARACHEAFYDLVELMGPDAVLDDMVCWLPSDQLAQFIEDFCRLRDILLDGYVEYDEDDATEDFE